jgi:hypothetical protein
MALVFAKDDLVHVIRYHQFNRGGPDVDADVKPVDHGDLPNARGLIFVVYYKGLAGFIQMKFIDKGKADNENYAAFAIGGKLEQSVHDVVFKGGNVVGEPC